MSRSTLLVTMARRPPQAAIVLTILMMTTQLVRKRYQKRSYIHSKLSVPPEKWKCLGTSRPTPPTSIRLLPIVGVGVRNPPSVLSSKQLASSPPFLCPWLPSVWLFASSWYKQFYTTLLDSKTTKILLFSFNVTGCGSPEEGRCSQRCFGSSAGRNLPLPSAAGGGQSPLQLFLGVSFVHARLSSSVIRLEILHGGLRRYWRKKIVSTPWCDS